MERQSTTAMYLILAVVLCIAGSAAPNKDSYDFTALYLKTYVYLAKNVILSEGKDAIFLAITNMQTLTGALDYETLDYNEKTTNGNVDGHLQILTTILKNSHRILERKEL